MIPADLRGAPYLRELARRLLIHAGKMRGRNREAGEEIRYAATVLEIFATKIEAMEKKEREDADRPTKPQRPIRPA